MISSFHFGYDEENGEKVMLYNFGGILCETSRCTMHNVFGFLYSDDPQVCAPGNFNYHESWYELNGCNNFQMSGTSCAFLRDDALYCCTDF